MFTFKIVGKIIQCVQRVKKYSWSVRSQKNIDFVHIGVLEEHNLSISGLSNQLGLSITTTCCLLRNYIILKAYKINAVVKAIVSIKMPYIVQLV